MNGLVILAAVVAAIGMCVLWDRALNAVVARQQRQEAEWLRRERAAEPPVLGGAPRRLQARGRSR